MHCAAGRRITDRSGKELQRKLDVMGISIIGFGRESNLHITYHVHVGIFVFIDIVLHRLCRTKFVTYVSRILM